MPQINFLRLFDDGVLMRGTIRQQHDLPAFKKGFEALDFCGYLKCSIN